MYTYDDISNHNGSILDDLMQENNLLAADTHFEKWWNKLWAQEDRATLMKWQLGYILVGKRWRNSVQNAEAYNSF